MILITVQLEDDDGDGPLHPGGVDDDSSVQTVCLDGFADPGVSVDDGAAVAPLALMAEAGSPRLPRLRGRLIGRLQIEGTLASTRRVGVLRVLLVLCLNLGRPITSGELRHRLAASDDSEPSALTVRSELSRLRKVLPDSLLPDREPGSGYRLPAEDVGVGWFVFKTLMALAAWVGRCAPAGVGGRGASFGARTGPRAPFVALDRPATTPPVRPLARP